MATQKRTKTKRTTSKTTAGKQATLAKRLAAKRSVKKKRTPKKTAMKKAAVKEAIHRKVVRTPKKQVRRKGRRVDTAVLPLQGRRPGSGGQSGDLQGLSNIEGADSESVDELLEEGNAFEADVVAGVEDAENSEEREVRTHEVPEDDVPGEYLDKE